MICLQRLCEIISLDIDKLLAALNFDMKKGSRSYSCACFHGSDNNHSLSLYERDNVYKWTCHTRSCQQTFTNSIIGFTRGVLSSVKEGWEKPGDRLYSFPKTINYLKELYGLTDGHLLIDHEAIEKKNSDRLQRV